MPRLPGQTFWIFDDGFAGSINFRYQPGTIELPPHVLGHAGYAVVPWQRRRGVATRALRALLPHVGEAGLERMMVTTDPGNVASQKVILAAGGVAAGTRPACERYPEQSVFWIALQWPPVVVPEPR